MTRRDRTQNTLKQLRWLSHWLDNAITIPGTSWRIGLDPIIGLIPAVGDYAGTVLSSYIVLQAARLGAPKEKLTQMTFNIILELLVGTVPVAGDLFDATWKANRQNLDLLEEHLKVAPSDPKVNWGFVILLLGIVALVLVGTTVLAIAVLQAIWQALRV
ncbi:MAG: DUF4112 domain-containing protein [Jaaginema sp. PMC 1079.18]|nr:DUF4112 domain-containing protein [Jaaginema sp. PMC 1080.18]MEC4850264.1 DUF4112 domain-containing protein [Jaaginema sp. PMC 1079.18]MEC4866910.1 DUF4112 domain-containing protein [Jaaginema sp. PMC 1078.18]